MRVELLNTLSIQRADAGCHRCLREMLQSHHSFVRNISFGNGLRRTPPTLLKLARRLWPNFLPKR
jgi:hypothetical protein